MAAKALLTRPNTAVICMVGSLSCLRRMTLVSKMTRSIHLPHRHSSHPRKSHFSCFYCPIESTHWRKNFCVKAAENPSPIDTPLIQSMEKKIKEHLNADSVIVKDAYGDGRHVSIEVISSAFEGQSAVNRQRMVYKAIWEELQDAVHAVDMMTTRTPSEATPGK